MKRYISITLLLAIAILLINKPGNAQTKVFIPDTNFRSFLNVTYPTFMDITGDSLLIDSAATDSGKFDCNNLSIADLTGVEYFINITHLDCSDNLLKALPTLSNSSALEFLTCDHNQLSALPELTGNPAGRLIDCYNNKAFPNRYCFQGLADLSAGYFDNEDLSNWY